jgi:hypothetical protein
MEDGKELIIWWGDISYKFLFCPSSVLQKST